MINFNIQASAINYCNHTLIVALMHIRFMLGVGNIKWQKAVMLLNSGLYIR